MSGRFGGEGTDQEGCWPQQVEHLQYVPRPCISMPTNWRLIDGQPVLLLLRNEKIVRYLFLRYHDRSPFGIDKVVEVGMDWALQWVWDSV